ncbi:MAG: hydroxyacylglutathione hydrolase [Hyphomicrobiales bacterium]
MSHLDVHQFICRDDNYGVLVHDTRTGTTISIDAPDATAIADNLKKRGWQLTHILTTHHHGDHVAGNLELKEVFGCRIIGPSSEADRIPGIGKTVVPGEEIVLAKRSVKVFGCPGHTAGHVAYHFPDDYLLFTADTVFAMGCGRIFEGTAEQMFTSVNQFRGLDSMTSIYCGHEYTETNARFAVTIEPGNRALQQRAMEVRRLREQGKMTCPTTIGDELKTNPYFRCASPEIRKVLGLEQASDMEVFAEIRRRKDNFR